MDLEIIQNRIFEVRGSRIMLDFHLAELYQVETRALKQAVKRNISRFPPDFAFQLTKEEWQGLITICDKFPENIRHTPTPPLAFCEQGVAMLSSVLRSQIAIQVNIDIMRAFIAVRQILIHRDEVKQGLERELNEKYVELKQSIEKLKQENEEQLSNISEEFENVDSQLKEIYEALTAMFQKSKNNEHRRPIGFIQEGTQNTGN